MGRWWNSRLCISEWRHGSRRDSLEARTSNAKWKFRRVRTVGRDLYAGLATSPRGKLDGTTESSDQRHRVNSWDKISSEDTFTTSGYFLKFSYGIIAAFWPIKFGSLDSANLFSILTQFHDHLNGQFRDLITCPKYSEIFYFVIGGNSGASFPIIRAIFAIVRIFHFPISIKYYHGAWDTISDRVIDVSREWININSQYCNFRKRM